MTFLEMTLSGAIFILVIAAVRAMTFRRLPKGAFVALWWAAALRLLVPVALPSRLSVYTLLEAVRPKAPEPAAPAVPVVLAAGNPSHVLIIPSQPSTAPQPEPFPIWTALWFTGAALLAMWFLVRYVRWRRRFRESVPVDCPGLETCLPTWRKVRLRVTDRIAAPLTYGLLRPVVLLPKTLDLRDEETVICVLAHELAHIRRLDSLFKLVLTAALCLHWFNPAAWLLYVLANRDMELRCDETAVLTLGEDSRARYALALIRMAELQNEYVPLCGFSHKSGMEERIRAIMSIKKKSLLACFAALALVLGITTAFATSAKPGGADPDGDPTDGEYLALISAEVAAQWNKLLAPYVPFGLTYTFDDPDHDGNGLTMAWEGHEVRGIYDEHTGEWITEHAGDGSYGPDAVELCAVYEGEKLTGLRLATEEEQAGFDRNREAAKDALRVEALGEGLRYNSGAVYFTIPEGEGRWNIWISGRIVTEDGMGLSVRYLEAESERAEWVPLMTYSFEVADAAYDELTMEASYGAERRTFDLTLILPENGAPLAQEPLPERREDIPVGADMIWPVDGGRITQAFGSRSAPGGQDAIDHSGVDIGGLEAGVPIYAAASGTVKASGFSAEHGNYVQLDHGNGLETLYAHCQSIEVKTGDTVALGQTIATVGSTGNSTGPHLHFEILVDGVRQNPGSYYRAGYDYAVPDSSEAAESGEKAVNVEYAKNSRGETYGSGLLEDRLGYGPDLISAVNDGEGTRGYVSQDDLSLPNISNPEEAVAYMNWREGNCITGWTIPLYDKEHNAIGTFQSGTGGSGSITVEALLEAQRDGWPIGNAS